MVALSGLFFRLTTTIFVPRSEPGTRGCFFDSLPLYLFRVRNRERRVASKQRTKICVNMRRVESNMGGEGKLLWLKRKGTQGRKSRRSWCKQTKWRRRENCKA